MATLVNTQGTAIGTSVVAGVGLPLQRLVKKGTLVHLPVQASWPATSPSPTLDARNVHPTLDFPASPATSIVWTTVLPRYWAGGPMVARIFWSATTAIIGSVEWRVSLQRLTNGASLASAVWGPSSPAVESAPTVSGQVQYTDVTLLASHIAGLLGGELCRVRVERTTSGSLAGDAELLGVELREG